MTTKAVNMIKLREHVTELRGLIKQSEVLALKLMKHPDATANQIMALHTHMVGIAKMINNTEPMLHKVSQSHIRPITLIG